MHVSLANGLFRSLSSVTLKLSLSTSHLIQPLFCSKSQKWPEITQVSVFSSCFFLLILKVLSVRASDFNNLWNTWFGSGDFSHVWHTELAWGDGFLCFSQSSDDLTGATLIPASPEAWSPYHLYTPELSPGLPHTAFTYPAAAAAAAAALHAQVRPSFPFSFLLIFFYLFFSCFLICSPFSFFHTFSHFIVYSFFPFSLEFGIQINLYEYYALIYGRQCFNKLNSV